MAESLVEHGRRQAAERARENAERRARQAAEADTNNRWRTIESLTHGFLYRFYEDRWIANPEYRGPYTAPRLIEDPKNPFPEIEWRSLDPGNYRATSEFTCEGLTFRCYWKAERNYGSDRADWDDGWWPTFKLVRVRHRRWPLRDQEFEVEVGSPAAVAEALDGD